MLVRWVLWNAHTAGSHGKRNDGSMWLLNPKLASILLSLLFIMALGGPPLGTEAGLLKMHTKVLKTTRESAEEDYKYLVQEFQPFPKDGTVSKAAFDKTMEL